ncbi:hypothetical protein ACIBAH_14155 [Streptomyces sp. NPDC051445]|uniref:hypothetical protein n=1 Tax=Streptomyces sp. NPDC051445 TaxID=3365653 RepID=UPI00378E9321
MAYDANGGPGIPGGEPLPATAPTLDRVRLDAGGPPARVRIADGRITRVVAEAETAGRAVATGGERVLDRAARRSAPGVHGRGGGADADGPAGAAPRCA